MIINVGITEEAESHNVIDYGRCLENVGTEEGIILKVSGIWTI